MRTTRSRPAAALAAVWLLAVGGTVSAQDAAAPTPPATPAAAAPDAAAQPGPNVPTPPATTTVHPIQRLRGDALRSAHRLAVRLVEGIRASQATVRASGAIDADNDGAGEAAVLQELANAIDHIHDPGNPPRFREPYLRADFGKVDANGVATVAGYCYRVWLPGKPGTFVSETPGARGAGVDPNASEEAWCVYAWPARYGVTGRFTIFASGAGVLVADVPAYSGADRGPEPGAALMPPVSPGGTGKPEFPSISAPATPGETGIDGNVWREAGSVQPSELDAPVPPRIDVWHDEKLLAEALAEACEAVAAAAGAPFEAGGRRPSARFARFDEIAAAIEAESGALMARFGVPASARRSSAEFTAGAMLAKYVPSTHTILVVPETAELNAAYAVGDVLRRPDAVRALLLHEVSHAHALQRHPLLAVVQDALTQDELLALNAVVEGHAQWLGARAARAQGRIDAFDAFSDAVCIAPRALGEKQDPALSMLWSGLTFPYVQGRRFFEAVEAARGIAGVEEALRDPPREPRMIERPARWLDRVARAGRFSGAQRASAVFSGIVPKEWSVVPQPMTVSSLRAAAESLVGADAAVCVDALDDVRVTTASHGSDMLVVAAMSFDDEASAQAYLAVSRAMQTAQDAKLPASSAGKLTENAGGSRPGFVVFTVRRMFSRDGIGVGTVTWVARVGNTVIEASLGGNSLAESKIEEAFEKIAAAAPPPEEKR